MNDERFLAKWLREAPYDSKETQEQADWIMARLPETKQRSRWWPLLPHHHSTPDVSSRGDAPPISRRTKFMLNPAKTLTAAALIFATGGLFLVAQPLEQQHAPVPAAADGERAEPVLFSGRMPFGEQVVRSTSKRIRDVWEDRGMVYQSSSTSSDPRMEGTLVMADNSDGYPSGVRVRSTVLRIENSDGAWQELPRINFRLPGRAQVADTTAIFVGEGAYEGLLAVAEMVVNGTSWDVEGVIVEGALPPAPVPSTVE